MNIEYEHDEKIQSPHNYKHINYQMKVSTTFPCLLYLKESCESNIKPREGSLTLDDICNFWINVMNIIQSNKQLYWN